LRFENGDSVAGNPRPAHLRRARDAGQSVKR
jgi:hypothetical protein